MLGNVYFVVLAHCAKDAFIVRLYPEAPDKFLISPPHGLRYVNEELVVGCLKVASPEG